MFEKLLVMTDASPASERLLDCVEGLRACGARSVVLCHVVEVESAAGLYDYLRTHLQPRLDSQKRRLEQAGFQVEVEIPLGEPEVEANRLAAEKGCGLIVVATETHGPLRDFLVGSLACSLLHSAEVPVFLARIEILTGEDACCRTVCRDLCRRVLFPTDFSASAEAAFGTLLPLVRDCRVPVTLLHVQDKARLSLHLLDRLEEFDRIDRQRLERLERELRDAGAPEVESRVVFGHPAEEILKAARGGDFSLILMGRHGRGFFAREVLGGVAHRIATHAPLPVIFTPAPPGEV